MNLCILLIIFLIFIILVLIWRIRESYKKESPVEKKSLLENIPKISSPESFETILKSITDCLLIIDPKGYILLANQSFKDIFKIEEPPESKHFIEIIRNIDLIELLRSSMETKKEAQREIIIKRAGQDFSLIAKAMPIIDSNGNISFLIILLHDITQLKKLENMRRDFIANVSHELKTPITAIKGYTEALLNGALDDRENLKKFIDIIKNQADRLSALVEDLLTLSRIEFGDIKIEKESVALDSLVDSVFQILRDKADKKGLFLEKEIPPETFVHADKNRFMQIMINLIDNAIKFTEKGFVKVKFIKENGQSIISVEDTGIGIPKEHLHRIGERFYRVDKARSRQLGGTGLGLAIVKHLVLAHGWQLKIESEVGAGTKVNILIPEEIKK
ncbi:Phosphate regulon sensor protein PhoR (SphS) [Thermodesulfovibrio sp. N1]|uniref:sensor histidine kinase n=1 Tax=Thermodesulfovibrio sp. N1 TaxID=1871110 RepID=UPI00083B8209|nr:ATP-binding protein [Thermodesulfovibrio sp. N1]ODA44054.1 Phosphate regulon sensor protein PhoR (SphS) [Thermodesulfovibrio sp. N1]